MTLNPRNRTDSPAGIPVIRTESENGNETDALAVQAITVTVPGTAHDLLELRAVEQQDALLIRAAATGQGTQRFVVTRLDGVATGAVKSIRKERQAGDLML